MPATNLPIYWTSYIDREDEQGEVARLLCLPTTRLITLTGPAGCGKSRLALQVAAEMASEYRDGVYWVDLATVTEASLVPQAIAAVLGVREEPGRRLMPTVIDYLRPRQVLLVLDNCSHMAGHHPPGRDGLLATCPHARILATSRKALGMVSEQIVRLRPLAAPNPVQLPHLDALMDYPAIRLFVERAVQASPAFALTPQNAATVVQICRQLDGLPLAIELAAARVRLMTVEQIADRLRDRLRLLRNTHAPEMRHTSLQAALDWSYAQLSDSEAALFRRLSVFAGGFTLEAVERVCADPTGEAAILPEREVLEALAGLIEKSLVEVPGEQDGAARYRLLYTVCAYAREKLKAADETDEFRRRHAEFYLARLETWASEVAEGQAAWLSRVEADYDDLRDSLDWFTRHEDVEHALRFAVALTPFWEMRGFVRAGREAWARILALLEQAEAALPAQQALRRVKALDCAARLAHLQSDYAEARRLYETSLALKRDMGDRHGVAVTLHHLSTVAKDPGDYRYAETLARESLAMLRDFGDLGSTADVLANLGLLAHLQGDMQGAEQLYADSLDLAEDLGDTRRTAFALSNISLLARNRGDYARALALSERSLALRREIGDPYGQAVSLANLGLIALFQGDFEHATPLQEESLAMFEEIENRWGIALLKCTLALTALYQGDTEGAARLARESRHVFEASGDKWGIAMAATTLAAIAARQGRIERARTLAQEGLALRCEMGDRHGIAESLEALAEAVAAGGRAEPAIALLGAAAAIRQAIGAPQSPVEARDVERWLAPIRHSMGKRAYETAFARGAAMSVDEALAFALGTGAAPAEADPPAATTAPLPIEDALRPEAAAPLPTEDAPPAEPQVRIFGFGVARVYRGDHAVTTREWGYTKPKELLYFLLSRGVRSRQQIGVMLWPDVSAEQLRNGFYPAVHHLRRVLGGNEWVVVAHDGYAFNRSLPYTYDVEAFEANIAEARRARQHDPQRAITCLQAAIDLYQGDFLEDVTGTTEWVLMRREELRRLYDEALLSLGELLTTAGRAAEAADVYRRAIAHDNLLEVAHRGLMRCLTRLGERSQAIRHYHSLEAILASDLGGKPAPETRALFERILRSEEV